MMLPNKVIQLSTDFGRLVREFSALRSAPAGIQTLLEEISVLKTGNAQELNLNNSVVEQLPRNFIELRKVFVIQNSQIAAMSLTVTLSQNQSPPPFRAAPQSLSPSHPLDASRIGHFLHLHLHFDLCLQPHLVAPSVIRCAEHFRLPGYLGRIPIEAIFSSVACQR
jgi:hypothetical protein